GGGAGRFDVLISAFSRWLIDFDPQLEPVLNGIRSLDDDDVRSVIDLAPDVFGRHAVRLLIDRAHSEIGDSPRKAANLCRVAIHIASRMWSSLPDEDVGLIGDSWRELGSALLSADEWTEA